MPRGSRPGERRGGRKKGTPNKATIERRIKMRKMHARGTDPMTFFMDILADTANPHQERKDAAMALLPYFHPKLASIEARVGGTSHEERLKRLAAMLEDGHAEGGPVIEGGVVEIETEAGAGEGAHLPQPPIPGVG